MVARSMSPGGERIDVRAESELMTVKRNLKWIAPVLIVLAAIVLFRYLGRGVDGGGPVLICCGGAREVGGSCHLVETGDVRFIVDCGDRGGAGTGVLPPSPETLSFVLLTHAHTDHCGFLPELYESGFEGPVYCTGPTAELAPVMLKMKRSTAWRGDSHGDYDGALGGITPVSFDSVVVDAGISFRFKRAGHLLGAASIEVWVPSGQRTVKIVFSGDLGSSNLVLVPPPACIGESEYVVMESTYGGTVRDGGTDEAAGRRREFAADVGEALGAGGDVLVPAFALGRTQEILAVINRFVGEGLIPSGTEVYVDSPTAKEITAIYRLMRGELSAWAREFYGERILRFPGLREVSSRTSMKVHARRHPASIFVSTSGDLGYASSPRHLMKMFGDPRNLLCIVGWQAPGSTGRRLAEGLNPVPVRYRESGELRYDWIAPLLAVKRYGCFSGHADQDGLLAWLRCMQGVKRVYLVHGEPDQMEALAVRITEESGIDVVIPRAGERYTLDAARAPAPCGGVVDGP